MCDDQIGSSLLQLSTGIKEPEGVLLAPRHRTKQPNQLSFNVRPATGQARLLGGSPP